MKDLEQVSFKHLRNKCSLLLKANALLSIWKYRYLITSHQFSLCIWQNQPTTFSLLSGLNCSTYTPSFNHYQYLNWFDTDNCSAVLSDSTSPFSFWSVRGNTHHCALGMTQTSLWVYAQLSIGHRVSLGLRLLFLNPRGTQKGRLILFVQLLFTRVFESLCGSLPPSHFFLLFWPWRQQQT